MLNRIFKTILVLSICVGISLPTNAAVSVSDGSAFVTKAEFAADLNNLSNRMAQLENSLDAKIDSLVSSYLTRNGIWNGAKQDVVQSYSNYIGLKNSNVTKTSYAHAYDSPKGTSNNTKDVVGYEENTKMLVYNLSKSGMCVVGLSVINEVKGAVTSFGNNNYRINTENSDVYPLNHFCNITLTFEINEISGSASETKYVFTKERSFGTATTFVQENPTNNFC